MNKALTFTSFLGIALCSSIALAQVAVKPRTGSRLRDTLREAPGAAQARPTGPSTALDGKIGQMGANKTAKGASCSSAQFAADLAAGTRVSEATARAAVDAKIVSMGTCNAADGGAAALSVEARENLLETAECTLNRGGKDLTGEQRDMVMAECLAEAKNNDAGAVRRTSNVEQLAAIKQLQRECRYLN